MPLLNRALQLIGFRPTETKVNLDPNYRRLMDDALARVRLCELQIQEATTLEELDVGRCSLQAAMAEVAHLVRSAKRKWGISLRPIAETEEMHRKLRDFMAKRSDEDHNGGRRRAAN